MNASYSIIDSNTLPTVWRLLGRQHRCEGGGRRLLRRNAGNHNYIETYQIPDDVRNPETAAAED